MKTPLRLALLISGGGTTMEAILKACQDGGPLSGLIEPALVIASTAKAGGIVKAVAAGIPTQDIVVIKPNRYDSPESFGRMILSHCFARCVHLIGQYGWMPKTPTIVMAAYPGMMINQHPGPLEPGWRDVYGRPLDFGGRGMYGMRVHAAVLYFARHCGRAFLATEATAQRVAAEFDAGPVLWRESVPISPNDDPKTLQERVLPVEHQVQIRTLEAFATGTVREQTRDPPLLKREEDIRLQDAKEVAKTLYPKG